MNAPVLASPSPLLDAALSILADGKPRSADEILAEGQRRQLFDRGQTRKHVYTALSQYVERTLGRGRKPLIIEEGDRRFRLNQPVDDWPALDTTGLPPLAIPAQPPPSAAATIAALQTATAGTDSAAFERAVCATFELFGFSATHVGGNDAPTATPMRCSASSAIASCLSASSAATTLFAFSASCETSKYRDAYSADFCALVAPSFDAEVTFVSELHTHGVAAWTVDDLLRTATLRLDCSQMRAFFAPGFAADPLDDFAWAVVHGPPQTPARRRLVGRRDCVAATTDGTRPRRDVDGASMAGVPNPARQRLAPAALPGVRRAKRSALTDDGSLGRSAADDRRCRHCDLNV